MNGKAADNGIPVGTGAARKAAPFAGAKVIGKSARTATETAGKPKPLRHSGKAAIPMCRIG